MELKEKIPIQAEAALFLLDKGFKIFPLYGIKDDGSCSCGKSACSSAGKHPMISNWQESGYFQTEEAVRQFWRQHPNANYGILTSGLIVFDIDERNGGVEIFEREISSHLIGISTFIVRTGSGGKSKHIYLSDPKKEIRTMNRWLQGVDVKADGGYVVGPCSKHMSGNFYEVATMGSKSSEEIIIAQIPPTLKKILIERDRKPALNAGEAKMSGFFGGEVREGSRNNSLTSYAGRLRRGGMEYEEMKRRLILYNSSFVPPLGESEVLSVLNSVFRYPPASTVDWGLPNFYYSIKDEDYKDISEILIPEFLRDFAIKKRDSLGVPASAIMVCLLTLISAILGAAFRIKPTKDTDYEETLNLWGLIVAPPSSKKTPIFKTFQPILDRIDEFFGAQRADFENNKNKDEAKLKAEIKNSKGDLDKIIVLEIELAQLKSKQIPQWCFFTNDATPEALGLLFKNNYRGILLFKDELKGLFALFSKQGYETLRAMLNEAWNGAKSFRSARVGRGMIDVKSATISVLGAAQPDVIRESFKEELQRGSGGDGLLARFQLCSIYSTKDLKEPNISIDLKKEISYIESLLIALHEYTKIFNLNGLTSNSSLVLSEESFILFSKYQKKIESILKSENPSTAYLCHIGKFGRLVLGLSGQFHILDCIVRNQPIDRPVEAKWVELAMGWADFMDEQAKVLYSSISKNNSAKTLISRIKSGDIFDGASVRSIYRKNWSGLQNRDDVLSAIEVVSDSNWIALVAGTPKGGGPTTEVIRLNPQLMQWLKSDKKSSSTKEAAEL